MTDLAPTLGLAGIVAVVAPVMAGAYLVSLRWRHTTWFTDIARLGRHVARYQGHPRCHQRPVPGNLWPVMGPNLPRCWRWPLNSTRWFCALLWHLVAPRRGLVGFVARVAWFPSAGIGAAASLVWATLATLTVSLPVAVGWWLIDTTTVLRGGTSPRSNSSSTARASTATSNRDWDQALADLVATQPTTSGVEHGIRIGPDGQALDPADQHALDRRRHVDQAQAADRRLDRIERILDREERLANRARNDEDRRS